MKIGTFPPWCTRIYQNSRIPLGQVVSQGAVIQIPEMWQRFQVYSKKSQLFENFPMVRSLDDDEASVSLGQVTKTAPDAKGQVYRYSRGTDPGRGIFRLRSLLT
ncbi:hypothetical protein TNCV_822241 [Trichonephila clavipes]|nr:hypothetical protein TNCV_822241 [Trichonephila clavipes]